MTRKGRAITLSISDHEKGQLEQLALNFEMTWGDNPNISKLIKAIALGKLRIAPNHDWGQERIHVLNLARNLLTDLGRLDAALEIAQLLLERGDIHLPLRQELQDFVTHPVAPWRASLDQAIRCQRPFRLSYQDATERIWHFTVRHARMVTYEDRQYLECWCGETEGNQDIPELRHNWCLRLDRIPEDAVLSSAEGHWQPSLAFVNVEICFLNRLALAYRTKNAEDTLNEWDGELRQRRVIRRVHNTFWFLREVRRYGADCVVVGPPQVRQLLQQELEAMLAHYSASPGDAR